MIPHHTFLCCRSQFRFVAGPKFEKHEIEDMKSRLEWQELEKRLSENGETEEISSPYIPGGGIAKSLFKDW